MFRTPWFWAGFGGLTLALLTALYFLTPLRFLVDLIPGGEHAQAPWEPELSYERRAMPSGPGWDRDLSYILRGDPDGRRVIFIHGTPGSVSSWHRFLANPARDLAYIAVDRPGFGKTGNDKPLVAIRDQAAALSPLLEIEGPARPILVGHSSGGPIAVRMGIDYPEKIGGLIVVAGALDPALEKVHWAQRLAEWGPLKAILYPEIRNSNQELLGLKAGLEDMVPRLAGLTLPVTVIHGTKDRLVPFQNVAFMKAHFTGAAPLEIEVLEGANHFLHVNGVAEVTAGITAMDTLLTAREREGDPTP